MLTSTNASTSMNVNEAAAIIEADEARKAKQREYSKQYYHEHPEECNERTRQWRAANPEKVREYNRNYRQKMKAQVQAAREVLMAAEVAKADEKTREPVRFKVDVPNGGSDALMSNEECYQAMKKAGRANCTFESFNLANQMITLGNSIIHGTAEI